MSVLLSQWTRKCTHDSFKPHSLMVKEWFWWRSKKLCTEMLFCYVHITTEIISKCYSSSCMDTFLLYWHASCKCNLFSQRISRISVYIYGWMLMIIPRTFSDQKIRKESWEANLIPLLKTALLKSFKCPVTPSVE